MSSGECKESILFKLFSIFFTYQSIQCNPCPVRKHLLHVSTHLFGFSHSLSGICQWELPSANTFFSTVCWSSRGLCSKARQEKGKTVQQREDGVSPSSSPAGLRRAGIQTRNLQIDNFPQPPPQATASPRGCVTRGLLKKCLRPWKKKKVLTFHTAENLNKCELQC